MNVATISESTYYRHTSSYFNPVIIQQWKEHQQQLLHSLSGNENGLILAGDGRCDSPGYSAKFGSFTLLEQQINRVVDFQLVQVSHLVQDWFTRVFFFCLMKAMLQFKPRMAGIFVKQSLTLNVRI